VGVVATKSPENDWSAMANGEFRGRIWMIQDLATALDEFRTLSDQDESRCAEMVTGIFDWRMRDLRVKGDGSTDASERLTANCDAFLTAASQYLESRANGKRVASVVVNHIAAFLVECDAARGEMIPIEVAEVIGACFAGSLFDLQEACDAVKRQKR
jgi:hypothetical protein